MALSNASLARNQEILDWHNQAIARDEALLGYESYLDLDLDLVPTPTSPRPLTAFAIEVFYRRQQHRPSSTVLGKLFQDTAVHYDSYAAIEGFAPKKADICSFPEENCPDAEPNFINLIRQVEGVVTRAEKQFRYHTKLTAYHDSDNVPLFLRKKSFASTALTLTSFQLGDIPIPAGTIVGLGHPARNTLTGQKQNRDITYNSMLFDPETHPILPLRLSPWAFADSRDSELFAVTSGDPLDNRPEDVQRNIMIDGVRRTLIARRALFDFQTAASNLLSYCQS